MTVHNELIERLKVATGPDREIDLALTNAFDLPDEGLIYRWGMQALDPGSRVMAVLEPTGEESDNPHFQQYVRDRYPEESLITPRSFTASIDACLALAKRLAGDRWYSILLDALRTFGAAGTLGPEHLPRFILLALLSALGAINDQ